MGGIQRLLLLACALAGAVMVGCASPVTTMRDDSGACGAPSARCCAAPVQACVAGLTCGSNNTCVVVNSGRADVQPDTADVMDVLTGVDTSVDTDAADVAPSVDVTPDRADVGATPDVPEGGQCIMSGSRCSDSVPCCPGTTCNAEGFCRPAP